MTSGAHRIPDVPAEAHRDFATSRRVVERFTEVCREDQRVLAAFISGSWARGEADAHSDVDLGLITTDQTYAQVMGRREALVRRLGEPLFLDAFSETGPLFFILADGTEGELAIGKSSDFARIAAGPHRVLVDKVGVLEGARFVGEHPGVGEQRETLRRLVLWFWHDVAHFITALVRGQRWWAYGELEVLRRTCASLLRLRADAGDPNAGEEPYFKLDVALPAETLAPLRETLSSAEPAEMLRAASAVLRLYRSLAVPLASQHGIEYPHELDRLLNERLAAMGVRE